jgi:hypothetical protein
MDMRALQRLEQMAAQQRHQLCRREVERRHFSEPVHQPAPHMPVYPFIHEWKAGHLKSAQIRCRG